MICIESPIGLRVLMAKGVIESGQLANMRRYVRNETIHCRILGEGKTLCGRPLHHRNQWSWQFIHRGSVAEGRVPSGCWPNDRDACKQCVRSPVLKATTAIAEARRKAIR